MTYTPDFIPDLAKMVDKALSRELRPRLVRPQVLAAFEQTVSQNEALLQNLPDAPTDLEPSPEDDMERGRR